MAEPDLEFQDGVFRVAGTDRGIGLLELARRLRAAPALPEGVPASLDFTGDYDAGELNFPNGCHVCEVEIDPATGQVRVDRYAAVDDVGVAINPMIVHGQVQGGVAQGLGQALMECVAYDAEGQLLSASFMDYALPRATDLPELAVALHEVPARSNPLGVKGVGRVRRQRLAGRGDERHRRRLGARRRAAGDRHAGDARSGVARLRRKEGAS